MTLALWLWRQHPTEIAADLKFRGVDIADWHYGTRDPRGWLKLSSRHLLELMANLPDRSAYKQALAGRDWPEDTEMLSEIHNTLAEFVAGHRPEGERQFHRFMSPAERRKHYDDMVSQAEEDSQALDTIYDQVGFSD